MTTEEREWEIKKLDGFYLMATDSIRGMRLIVANLATDYPKIENSLPELERAESFIREEWLGIHNKMEE